MTRLEYWKEHSLDEKETRAIADIEKYDCHVIQVAGGHNSPVWSYSLGLVDTLRCPEIVVIGLPDRVALWVIDEIRDRVRGGLQLKPYLQLEGLLEGSYVCELREVRPQWYKWLLGWATWFHGSDNYPALQCVYPDKNHRFPWQEGFNPDWLYLQPILDRDDAVEARMDRLVASMEETGGRCTCPPSREDWIFADDPHSRAITQRHVVSGRAPILSVFHDRDDGTWQMLDGSDAPADVVGACLHHLVDLDPTLNELTDLPLGWQAWRSAPGTAWQRGPYSEDE